MICNKHLQGYVFIVSVLSIMYTILILFNGVWQPIVIAYLIYSLFNPFVLMLYDYFGLKIIYTALFALCICYSSILLLVIYIIPIAQYLIESVIMHVPHLTEWMTRIQQNAHLAHMMTGLISYIQNMLQSFLAESGKVLYAGISYCCISPLMAFYMILRRQHIKHALSYLPELNDLLFCINYYWLRYITSQIYLCIILMIYYISALYLSGMRYFLQLGSIIGLVSFMPYIGFIMGFTVTMTTCVMYYSISMIYTVLIVFIIGQILEHLIFTPVIIGNTISPLSILFVMLVSNHILGMTGAILTLPIICFIQGLWKWWIHR